MSLGYQPNSATRTQPLHARFKPAAPQVESLRCVACAKLGVTPFMQEELRPLATVFWPDTASQAQSMKKLPLAFCRCIHCGHVFNAKFRYDEVPYSRQPNLMYNQGSRWADHIKEVIQTLVKHIPETPRVVEIGCGDGHLLKSMSSEVAAGSFIGFDPNQPTRFEGGIEFRAELFEPQRHLHELKPDLLICRHVLEHLENPLEFLEKVATAAAISGPETWMFVEVPCIDQAIESGRIVDFYYEHNSHFTSKSFAAMLERSGAAIEHVTRKYGDEVLCGLVKFSPVDQAMQLAQQANAFLRNSKLGKARIQKQLETLFESGAPVAIWGGTGKAASFLNYYEVDAARFPCVVDSDLLKCDTFVPGTGQRIQNRDTLIEQPVDVIIIPMQWRARDILLEARQAGISYRQVLIEHLGELIDFDSGRHPY